MRVGIIGLGYVGLPLAVAFAEAGNGVVGVDVDSRTVESLREGHSEIEDERVVADRALVVDFRGVTRGIAAHNLIRP
jgi:UDP-N-acetyl-D-glucosamine dehydrogenase